MLRAWSGCLNAGTLGDTISTRRIPICQTVPWQPSYCLNSLNSGGMTVVCLNENKSHYYTCCQVLFNLQMSCSRHSSNILTSEFFGKVLAALQKPVQSQSTWLQQCTCLPEYSLVWCLGVEHQSPRIWAKYRRASLCQWSTQAVSIMCDVKQVFTDFRSFHDANRMLISVNHFI